MPEVSVGLGSVRLDDGPPAPPKVGLCNKLRNAVLSHAPVIGGQSWQYFYLSLQLASVAFFVYSFCNVLPTWTESIVSVTYEVRKETPYPDVYMCMPNAVTNDYLTGTVQQSLYLSSSQLGSGWQTCNGFATADTDALPKSTAIFEDRTQSQREA